MAKEEKVNLQNPCHQMLQAYPLYNYRAIVDGGKSYQLQVLVLGTPLHGSFASVGTICGELLAQGQLLDTELSVTAAVPDAESAEMELYSRSLTLSDFVSIRVDGKRPAGSKEPAQQDCLAGLQFVTLPQDDESIQNFLRENRIFHYVVRILPDGTLLFLGNGASTLPVAEFREQIPGGEADLTDLQRIALNMHISYAKSENPHATYEAMCRDFLGSDEDGHYNYNANMKAALHVQSKIICALEEYEKNNDPEPRLSASLKENWDNEQAAACFAEVLRKSPELLNRLSALEHQRWVLDKILSGYRQTQTLDVIYQRPEGKKNLDGTHGCNDDKWHTCLVPCGKSGESCLSEEDFAFAQAQWTRFHSLSAMEKAGCFSANFQGQPLDPLDQMSLKIHIRCGELSHGRREEIDALLASAREEILSGMVLTISNREDAVQLMDELSRTIAQMWQHKRPAVDLYKATLQKLNQLAGEGSEARRRLQALHEQLLPLCEYVSNKDYKELDRILVQQIPFALTHRPKAVLWKLLSGQENTDFFSSWKLEPAETVFLAPGESTKDLLRAQEEMTHLRSFFRKRQEQTAVSCILLVPQDSELAGEPAAHAKNDDVTVQLVPSGSIDSFSRKIEELLLNKPADYMDITAGDPLLEKAAEDAARRCGAPVGFFYIREGKLRNLRGARELEYIAPEKEISVREMFELSGTVFADSETTRLSDFSAHYIDLWKIADNIWKNGLSDGKRYPDGSRHMVEGNGWDIFCKHAMSVHKADQQPNACYTFSVPDSSGQKVNFAAVSASGSPDAILEAVQTLRVLTDPFGTRKVPYVRDLELRSPANDTAEITFEIRKDVLDPDKDLGAFLEDCCAHFQRGDHFTTRTNKDTGGSLIYHSLSVLALPERIKQSNRGAEIHNQSGEVPDVRKTLQDMANAKLPGGPMLTGLTQTGRRSAASFSFRYASREIFSCMQSSGKVLEYYIYYAALLNGHFHDVEMGYKYRHSGEAFAASNELDVICTKGMRSLFISVKMRKLPNDIKDILYEISLQARLFGIQATPVLAAPCFKQFKIKDDNSYELSDPARNALSRGVCLLGEECFQDEVLLAGILDSIMAGEEHWYRLALPGKTL